MTLFIKQMLNKLFEWSFIWRHRFYATRLSNPLEIHADAVIDKKFERKNSEIEFTFPSYGRNFADQSIGCPIRFGGSAPMVH